MAYNKHGYSFRVCCNANSPAARTSTQVTKNIKIISHQPSMMSLSALRQCLSLASLSSITVANNVCPMVKSDEAGKLAFDVSAELLKDFLSLGFSCTRISEMLGVSR